MELQLEPIHEANINDELLEHFETHTSPIMSSGFELLGDFYLKDEPYNAKARILLGNGQAVFAEIGTTLGVYYLELISFFENGEYASTCSIATFPNKEKFAQRGIHVNAVEPMDFAQLLASHLDFLASISAQIGQPVCEIDLPQWKDYHQYHNQKFGLVRYELGEIAEPPESCVFPTQSGDSQLETESPSFA